MKLDSQTKGLRPLLPPVIWEDSFRNKFRNSPSGTSADIIYAIDADLGKMLAETSRIL
jgi:hypothetical protein